MSPRVLHSLERRDAASVRPRPEIAPEGTPLSSYVPAACAGDEAARATLIDALLPRARNLVRYLVRGDAEVDDIVQDALITVLERIGTYRGEGRFEHWADGVVMRVTLHRLRRMRLRLRRFVSSPPEAIEALAGSASPGPLPERYLARRAIVRALDRLPYKQRHALVLHHVLGMTVPEVAGALDVPVETVHSRLRVGMQRLRRHLPVHRARDAEETPR